MKKIELLAPAGNMESLYAAVQAGCDAIYLGGTLFSARAFAGNFNNEEIVEAIRYCHLYGVKVYVTCNILIYEHEVNRFLEYVSFLHQNNVDAILIQDLGMFDLVHQTFPNLVIHASTQMHIHNLDGILMAKKLGFSRVVLARETPIEKIKEITYQTQMEIEIFGHGSLCVSYSGQCLFSSLIGNRSGNRGSCVGSCRLPYNILDEDGNKLNIGDYPLSMKDLNTLEYLEELIQSGVTSLKIEGRMKSPEYVYTVTKLYREAIDSYYRLGKVIINQELLLNLQKIFSRGYTKGYLFNEDMHNIINSERGNHQGVYLGKVIEYKNKWIKIKLANSVSILDGLRIILDKDDYGIILNEFYLDGKLVKEAKSGDIISLKVNKDIPKYSKVLLTKDTKLIKEIDELIKKHPRKVPITIKIKVSNKSLSMLISDNNGNIVEKKSKIVEVSKTRPTTKEELLSKIKLGDTIYELEKIDIDIPNNIFIPYKAFNDLRHQLIEELNNKRIGKSSFVQSIYQREVKDYPKEELRSVLVNKVSDNLSYDIIYSENKSDNAIIKLPKVMDNYDNLDLNREYLIGEIGALNKLKNVDSDYSLNVTNSYTVALLHSLGVKRITLSLELTPKQIENIICAYFERYNKHPNLEVIILGKREVMTLKTNLNKIYQRKKLYLEDRFKNHYLIRDMGNLSYIYEPNVFNSLFDYYHIGINVLRENLELEEKV